MADQAQWQISGDYLRTAVALWYVPVSSQRQPLSRHDQQKVSATSRLSFTSKAAATTASHSMDLMWRSQSKRLGRWQTETGPWRPISMSALTTSKPRPWGRFSPVLQVGPWQCSRR